MNNPYVTKKTTRPRPWQGAILGICGFFTIVIGSMVPDYVTKKGAIDNGVLFALLLGGVIRQNGSATGLRITGRPVLHLTNYRRRSVKVQLS